MATAWTAFAGLLVALLALVVLLARASARILADDAARPPTGALLRSVLVSHTTLAAALLGGAWLADVPRRALGLDAVAPSALGYGIVAGLALYAADEALATVADRLGVPYSDRLRESLTPETRRGWLVLLGGVLPVVAGFEELLFRGAVIGALAVGFGAPPWALAVASSVLFGAAHGAQGPGGVAVAAVLGFGLAATFVLTGSLLTAVVAHYLVNALEFAVHGKLRTRFDI